MIRNYFKIAWRNIINDKVYSFFNISGLAIGLACFAFIGIWVIDELSYDRFNKNADRIFRVTGEVITQSEAFKQAVTAVPMAAAFKNDYSEVIQTVRFDPSDAIIELGEKQFAQDGILATDNSFFEVFSYSLKKGDPNTILNEPYQIVLTESMAIKYFGAKNPIGETLRIFLYDPLGKGKLYTVSGIISDPPKNAHFTFTCLVSFKSLETANPESTGPNGWDNNSYFTYLLLQNKKDHLKIGSDLDSFLERNRPRDKNSSNNRYIIALQPLTDIHLKSNLRYEIEQNGNQGHIYIFITIGLFILLIASINYINLATARSLNRSKEVGIKKVLGASKSQLIVQHITESVLISICSFALSLGLIYILKPTFIYLSGKELLELGSINTVLYLFLISVVIGLLSGIYPAFFITRYKAGNVLKGTFKSSQFGIKLRKSLVVIQFTIAVVLISGILVVDNQLNFIKNKDLGFNKEGLVSLKVNGNADVLQNFDAFKNDLLRSTLIKGVGRSNSMIIGGLGNSGARTINGEGTPLSTGTYRLRIDPDYIDVYDMEITKGRNFYKNEASDSLAYIVNEAAVKAFGWKHNDDALNKPFEMGGRQGFVVGVVKDFNFNTLQHPIEPLVLLRMRNHFSQITLKADVSNPGLIIEEVSEIWNKHFPGSLMEYGFVDEKLNKQYLAEERYFTFIFYFSTLAILIACIGLLGLTAYTTHQRIKEIGIRKVLGAGTGNITLMLSYDFLKLILISAIIGFPISWILMQEWLQDFAFRIDIGTWVFIKSGFISLAIALLTICYQAIKAAIKNPIEAIRTE